MACVGKLSLMIGMLLCLGIHLCCSQHWSHGWYPGGKRELHSLTEVPDEIKLCEGRKCSYPRPQQKNILKTILVEALTKQSGEVRRK